MRGPFLGAALGLGVLLLPTAARAGEEVAAETLFNEAKKLAGEGKYAQACPIFAESNRLDRGAGTMIHLGDCYEKNKQSASAWATFTEAASAAQAINRKDWEKLARQRAAALEPKLARLTIKVDPANTQAEVSRDGTPVAKAIWGVAIPVDIGAHAIEAKAAGHKTFTTSATVVKDGEKLEVSIPKLEVDETAPPPVAPPVAPPQPTPPVTPVEPPPPDADHGSGSGRRTVGFIVGGVGVAGLAVGAITGLMAMGKSSDAKDACAANPCTSRQAVDDADSARSLATVSTVGFIAGGALLAAGAVLVFTAPSAKSAAAPGLRFAPHAGANNAGLTVLGTF